ncbi:MAG: hypothetical protein QXV69_10160 [Sulfolobaceae archaeon]
MEEIKIGIKSHKEKLDEKRLIKFIMWKLYELCISSILLQNT